MSTINTGDQQTPEQGLMIDGLYGLAVSPAGYAIAKTGVDTFINVPVNPFATTVTKIIAGSNIAVSPVTGIGDVTISSNILGGIAAASQVKFADGAVGAPAVAFTTDPTTGFYHTGTGATGAILAAVNGVNVLTMLAGGNVGIGTMTPGAKFTVNAGEGAFVGLTAQVTNQNGLMMWGGTNGGTIYARGDAAGGDDHLVIKAIDDIQFSPGSSQTVVFKSGGKVGIGITAPTATLHLKAGTATASTAPIKFTQTASALLASVELGALEFVDNGTTGHLYITVNIAGVATRVLIV